MNILILDKKFDIICSVGEYNSFIWTRRLYEKGMFELHTSSDKMPDLMAGTYLYRSDRTELGVIKTVEYDHENSAQCKVTGYFVECLLDDRVIELTTYLNGTPEAIGRLLVNKYIINPADEARKISNVVLGAENGVGTSISTQNTGDVLGEYLYSIEEPQQLSHRLVYDFLTNQLAFEVWQGKDRTDSQTENSWALFSDSFYNVTKTTYTKDDSNTKNFAYVAGEGEGTARTVVEVDLTEGADRKELYVDANDLQSTYEDEEGVEHTYTTEEYQALLYQRGIEKLAEYETVESAEVEVDTASNLKYMEDYDLGDKCMFQDTRLGISYTARITEVRETYEGASMSLSLDFGNNEITSISKLIRRETT